VSGLCQCDDDGSVWRLHVYSGSDCSTKIVPWLVIGLSLGVVLLLLLVAAGVGVWWRRKQQQSERSTTGWSSATLTTRANKGRSSRGYKPIATDDETPSLRKVIQTS
jgi:hypothetical protein